METLKAIGFLFIAVYIPGFCGVLAACFLVNLVRGI
jgi:hypothetical protein